MKNNLENSIRDSLNNLEIPYNAAAWKSLSTKLDAKMPVKPFKTKWYVAAGVLFIAALSTSLFLFSNKENTNKTVLTENSNNSTPKQNNTNENNTSSTIESENKNTSNVNVVEEKTEIIDLNNLEKNDMPSIALNEEHEGDKTTQVIRQTNNDSTLPTEIKEVTSPENLIIPVISSICIGDEVKIENVNDAEIVVGGPWFKQIIEPHSTVTITFDNEGTYVIGPEEADGGKNLNMFSVKPKPDVDFYIDSETKYESGLPTTLLSSHSEGEIVWNYGKTTSHGSVINPHFFKKGNHTVQITIEGTNGCTNTTEKDIYIDESYNLMAVNSFIPQDIDTRRNTFMPFALTQREDVQFTLIVLDPSDGHVVFQTDDVTNGWTAIDQQTGQSVKYEKAYIWKVIISNPVQGEDGEYAGTITPLTK